MSLHYGKVFKIPRKIIGYILRLLYPIVIKIWPLPSVLSIPDTMEELISKEASIVRFGDSEFLYICDKLSLPYQKWNKKLADKMKYILQLDDPKLIVGLPIGFESLETLTDQSANFWKTQISYVYPRLQKILKKGKIYGNASITRIYNGLKDKTVSKDLFNKFRQIWEEKDLYIIEGEKSRMGVGNDLFHNAESIKRILAPSHNSFDVYDEILEACESIPKNAIVLTSLGPCAKALTYDLYKKGYRVIDTGNLDIEYEWFKRSAQKKIKIPGKYTSEVAGGRIVEDIKDPAYLSQIIKHIKISGE